MNRPQRHLPIYRVAAAMVLIAAGLAAFVTPGVIHTHEHPDESHTHRYGGGGSHALPHSHGPSPKHTHPHRYSVSHAHDSLHHETDRDETREESLSASASHVHISLLFFEITIPVSGRSRGLLGRRGDSKTAAIDQRSIPIMPPEFVLELSSIRCVLPGLVNHRSEAVVFDSLLVADQVNGGLDRPEPMTPPPETC